MIGKIRTSEKGMDTVNKEEILNKINEVSWHHSFELLPGLLTPGTCHVNAKNIFDSRYEIPQSLSGLKILDIGAWDGPYSFELERRGADVVALDIQDPSLTGFNIAKEILQSRVKYIRASVYDLTKVLTEKFDIVLFLGVYYHLKCPVLAFEQISYILKNDGLMLIEGECLRNYAPVPEIESKAKGSSLLKKAALPSGFIGDMAQSNIPVTLFYSGAYKNDPSNWFIPNFACIREWLSAAGLELISHGFRDKEPTQRFWGIAKKTKDAEILLEHRIVGKKENNS